MHATKWSSMRHIHIYIYTCVLCVDTGGEEMRGENIENGGAGESWLKLSLTIFSLDLASHESNTVPVATVQSQHTRTLDTDINSSVYINILFF